MEIRVGQGFDVHRLVEGRALVLGGILIPYERGLEGHSDADVVLHAAIDALLGAAALGDIGTHFPNTDPRWKGISSLELTRLAWTKIHAQGWRLGNLDVHIHCERPRLAPFIPAMCQALASCIEVEAARVSIKAGTCEGLGPVGRGEGIMASAVALLHKGL